jgi:hypothetical protein
MAKRNMLAVELVSRSSINASEPVIINRLHPFTAKQLDANLLIMFWMNER